MARQGPVIEIIGHAGYLSMNAAAWQPSQTAPERCQAFAGEGDTGSRKENVAK
jgi:hypothetical protein